MDGDEVEIIVSGAPGQALMGVADRVALALIAAGATVDFPGGQRRSLASARALMEVRAVIRVGEKAPSRLLPGGDRRGLDWPTAGRVAAGLALLAALFEAELRLHFGIRLDAIITAAAVWWFWRHIRRRNEW